MEMKKSLLVGAALAGLSLTGVTGCASSSIDPSTIGQCHGVNSCKGKGACGGAGHACAGKNGCKGKGWVKATKGDCDGKGGEFKQMAAM